MKYEIQAEYIPGNNQIWMSFKTEENKFIYLYDAEEIAISTIETIKNSFPEGTKFRIIEHEDII